MSDNGANGLDGFSTLRDTTTPSNDGAPGLSEAAARLTANRWDVRGPALAARVHARHKGDEPFVPMPEGWEALSRMVAGLDPSPSDEHPKSMRHGWRPGVYYLTAGTGVGKSQFAIQCAVAAANADVPAGIIGLELDDLGLYTRAASMVCGETDDTRNAEWERTNWSQFYNGRVANVPAGVQRELAGLPIYPFEPDAHQWGAEKLDEFVTSMREAESYRRAQEGRSPLAREAPVFVVLDFLQLVGPSEKNPRAEMRERISAAAYRARMVARQSHAVVLAVSSIPRAAYGAALVDPDARLKASEGASLANGKNASPSAATLRDGGELVGLGKESGDVEFSADGVLVLCPYRREQRRKGESPEVRNGTSDRWRNIDVCIAKLRAGPADRWCTMRFDGSRFSEEPGAQYGDSEAFDMPDDAPPRAAAQGLPRRS